MPDIDPTAGIYSLASALPALSLSIGLPTYMEPMGFASVNSPIFGGSSSSTKNVNALNSLSPGGGGLPISALALLGGGLLGGMGYLSDITGIGASPYTRALSGISLGNLPDPQQFISSMAAVAGARGAESQIALQSRLANMGALPGGATAALSQKARSQSDVEYLKIQPEIIRQATELAQLRANLELQKAMGKSQSGIFGDILGGAQTAASILSALKLVGLL
jgi:hypothetical protein